MNQDWIAGLIDALGLLLMLGFTWAGGGSAIALTLIGLGAVLMVVVCVVAEFG
jgi:hypothetical protein